jgi:hypothetical protein
MVDRINAGTGERHEAQPIRVLCPRALWVQNVRPLPTEGNGNFAVQRLHRAPTPVPHREGRHYRPRGFP